MTYHDIFVIKIKNIIFVKFAKLWKTVCSYVAVLLHASSSCAFLDYLTFNVDDNGVDFPQCVSKCAFSD